MSPSDKGQFETPFNSKHTYQKCFCIQCFHYLDFWQTLIVSQQSPRGAIFQCSERTTPTGGKRLTVQSNSVHTAARDTPISNLPVLKLKTVTIRGLDVASSLESQQESLKASASQHTGPLEKQSKQCIVANMIRKSCRCE